MAPGTHLNTGDVRKPGEEAVSPMESEQDLKTIRLYQSSQKASELPSRCWRCMRGG